ncbi:MAG: type II toxin-antitoxin system VapC family toxin [Chthoniobacterales bacterium]|nr:type II toxin-antitoxin system VapC family toxin [Chthoniobacterales bacterium]
MTIIADTGPIAALFNPKDQWHSQVVETSRKFLKPAVVVTCEAVVTEVFFLLRSSQIGVQNFAEALATPGLYIFPWSFQQHCSAVMDLYLKYNDRPTSFADMCLLHMASTIKDSLIWTLDCDFQIYRLAGNKPVPILS